jgi:hypothetical protein
VYRVAVVADLHPRWKRKGRGVVHGEVR